MKGVLKDFFLNRIVLCISFGFSQKASSTISGIAGFYDYDNDFDNKLAYQGFGISSTLMNFSSSNLGFYMGVYAGIMNKVQSTEYTNLVIDIDKGTSIGLGLGLAYKFGFSNTDLCLALAPAFNMRMLTSDYIDFLSYSGGLMSEICVLFNKNGSFHFMVGIKNTLELYKFAYGKNGPESKGSCSILGSRPYIGFAISK